MVESGTGPGSINVLSTPQNPDGVITSVYDYGSKSIVVGNGGLMQGIDGTLQFVLFIGQDSLKLDDSQDSSSTTATIDTYQNITHLIYGRVRGLGPGTVSLPWATRILPSRSRPEPPATR